MPEIPPAEPEKEWQRAPFVHIDRRDGHVDIPEQNVQTLFFAVRRQLDWETACYFAGIEYRYLLWLAKQAELYPNGPARLFLEEMARVVAEGKAILVQKIYADPDVKNARWILERKYPSEWGPRLNVSRSPERALSEIDQRLRAIAEAEQDADDGMG